MNVIAQTRQIQIQTCTTLHTKLSPTDYIAAWSAGYNWLGPRARGG